MGCESITNTVYPDFDVRHHHKLMPLKKRLATEAPPNDNLKKQYVSLSEEDKGILDQALATHFLLYRLSALERERLIEEFQTYYCEGGKDVFLKGSVGNFFFVVKKGKVSVRTEHRTIGLERGECFGELALMYASTRLATVKAETDCFFFCIDYKTFRVTLQELLKKNFETAKSYIEKVPMFRYFPKKQKTTIAYNAHIVKYEKDTIVFKEGDAAKIFYVIISGQVCIEIPGKEPLRMEAGSSFGENSFENDAVRSGTCRTVQVTSLLALGRQAMRKCLGRQIHELFFYNILKWSLSRDKLLGMLTDVQRERIISLAKIQECRSHEIIMQQGDKVSKLIICLEGTVNQLETGTIFNTEYLTAQDQNQQLLTHRLIKQGKGHVAVIGFESIQLVVGRKKFQFIYQQSNKEQLIELTIRRKQYLENLDLVSFKVVCKLGQGQFGKVYLVEDGYRKQYALKCIRKNKIIENKMQKFITKEKQLLQMVNHPFVMKYYRSFKDEHFIYFLNNFIDGADFFDVLRQIGICDGVKAQFYTACFILILEHLHSQNILYRDLKPENAVMDRNGYLNLIDLGTGKIMSEDNGYRTFTIIGTPHYMAPEIIEVQGYSFPVDLWSLGVVMYEMMCGILPFANNLHDPYEVFKQIDTKQLSFPKFFKNNPAKEIIEKLLSRVPSDRFFEDFTKIKMMAFFDGFDWNALTKKTMKAPFKITAKEEPKRIDMDLTKYLKREKASLGDPKPAKIKNWDDVF